MREIAKADAEQAGGVQEVACSVAQLDAMTWRNATMAAETAREVACCLKRPLSRPALRRLSRRGAGLGAGGHHEARAGWGGAGEVVLEDFGRVVGEGRFRQAACDGVSGPSGFSCRLSLAAARSRSRT